MMHPDTIKNLNNIKDAASKDGATVYGGKRIIEKGYEKAHYMEPILIVEQGQNDRMLKTEPFGPCMHIIPVDNDKDMPKLMNAGKKDGLTSSFHTLNPDLMNEYHLQVKAGNRNENQKTSGAPVYAAFGPHNGGQVAGQGDASFKQYQQRVTTIESTNSSNERSPSVKKILAEREAKMAIERQKDAAEVKQFIEPDRKKDYYMKSIKSDKQVLGKGYAANK
jgi:acyl-CoA reductase-like NAD-dependent aldehyde dehydrogenase